MKAKFFISIIALTGMFYGCMNTKIVSSWRDPDTTIQKGQYKKVLVLALVQNEGTRRVVEDKLVSYFSGNAVASYKYLTQDDLKADSTTMKVKFNNDGFDGMVTLQLIKADKEVDYVPGSTVGYGMSPYGYYPYAYGMYSTPGYYTVNNIYTVESNFYSLKPQKLVWSGITNSIEPGSVEQAASEIATMIKNEMVKQGFLVEKRK